MISILEIEDYILSNMNEQDKYFLDYDGKEYRIIYWYYVIYKDNKPIAYIMLCEDWFIGDVYIDIGILENYRNKNLGKILMNNAITYFWYSEFDNMNANIDKDNVRCINFINKFKEFKLVEDYDKYCKYQFSKL